MSSAYTLAIQCVNVLTINLASSHLAISIIILEANTGWINVKGSHPFFFENFAGHLQLAIN